MNTQPNQPKAKRNSWRDLTDEERWKRIYAGREKKEAQKIKSLPEAVALALPPYAMYRALEDMASKNVAHIRPDVTKAVVGSVALVASRLVVREREPMADKLESLYGALKGTGFYLDAKEFFYCVSSALVKLVDEGHYPPDAPAVAAALMIVEDAVLDEAGDWNLKEDHAAKMSGKCYDVLLTMGIYGRPPEARLS